MVDFLDSPGKTKPRGKKGKQLRSMASESESDAYVNAHLSQSENSSDEPLQEDLRQDVAELRNPVVGNPKKSTGLSGNVFLPPPASAPAGQSIPIPAVPEGQGAAARRQAAAVCAMCGNAHQG